MRLTFPGTRGGGNTTSTQHHRHSTLLIETAAARVLFDWGRDWHDAGIDCVADALFLTHAHDDHTGGLTRAIDCPVWATAATHAQLPAELSHQTRTIRPFTPLTIGDLTIQALPVAHSRRAPTVGYRIRSTRKTVFYCPDVAGLADPEIRLRGVDLYIGDGSCHQDSLLRVDQGVLCGHAPMQDQLGWCVAANVPRAIFTHIGDELISGNTEEIVAELCAYGAQHGLQVSCAHDGLTLEI